MTDPKTTNPQPALFDERARFSQDEWDALQADDSVRRAAADLAFNSPADLTIGDMRAILRKMMREKAAQAQPSSEPQPTEPQRRGPSYDQLKAAIAQYNYNSWVRLGVQLAMTEIERLRSFILEVAQCQDNMGQRATIILNGDTA